MTLGKVQSGRHRPRAAKSASKDFEKEEDALVRQLTQEFEGDSSLSLSGGGRAALEATAEQPCVSSDEGCDEQLSLYERLGGGPAVQEVVRIFYKRIREDHLLQEFFDGINMDSQRRKQLLFMSFIFGGPDSYTQHLDRQQMQWPESLARSHAKLFAKGLCEMHFDRMLYHLSQTLEQLNVPQALIDEASRVVETTRRAIFPLPGTREYELKQQAIMEVEAHATSGPHASIDPKASSTICPF